MKLLFNIEKKESKKLKSFKILLEYMNQRPPIRAGRARAVQVEEMYLSGNRSTILYLKILAYLDNPSEEAVSESSQIKEEH